MMSLAKEFGLAVGAIHKSIKAMRKQLREQPVKLVAQEREQGL
jgi:hypothetical protein